MLNDVSARHGPNSDLWCSDVSIRNYIESEKSSFGEKAVSEREEFLHLYKHLPPTGDAHFERRVGILGPELPILSLRCICQTQRVLIVIPFPWLLSQPSALLPDGEVQGLLPGLVKNAVSLAASARFAFGSS